MGRTFAQSFLSAHIIRPDKLFILQKQGDTYQLLQQLNLCQLTHTPSPELFENAEIVLLAVKPQDAPTLFKTLTAYLPTNTLILSIMAGIKMQTIAKQLNTNKVIRAMPNLPSQIGMGMTAFTATAEVQRKQLTDVHNLLNATGRAIYLENETLIDASTAISGSGPAYVFYFMQALIHSAMQIGFNESEAEILVWQTLTGSLYLHNKNDLSCQQWIQKVASKGGTTEAALQVMNQNQLQQIIQKSIQAAFERAQQLGK